MVFSAVFCCNVGSEHPNKRSRNNWKTLPTACIRKRKPLYILAIQNNFFLSNLFSKKNESCNGLFLLFLKFKFWQNFEKKRSLLAGFFFSIFLCCPALCWVMPSQQGIPEISARQLHLREALISRMPHSLSIPYTKDFLSQGLELLIRCMHCCGTCPSILVPDLTHTFMKFKPKFYAPILHQFIVSLPWAELPTGYQKKDKIKLHYIFQKMELSLLEVFRFPK
jgi:hypothetical protein